MKQVIELPVGIAGLTLVQAKGQPALNVTVAEIYKALAANPYDLPYLVVHGRRGGSALCASAINALAQEKEIA